jgi:hypothetical protein
VARQRAFAEPTAAVVIDLPIAVRATTFRTPSLNAIREKAIFQQFAIARIAVRIGKRLEMRVCGRKCFVWEEFQ